MRISVDDTIVERLEALLPAGDPGGVPGEIDRLLRLILARPDYAPGTHLHVLTTPDLQRLTAALNRSILPASVDQLVAYAERLGRLQLGTVQIGLSQGQLEEVAHRAAREGQTPQQYLARMAAAWASTFFALSPVREEIPVVEHHTIEVEAVDLPDAQPVVQVVG